MTVSPNAWLAAAGLSWLKPFLTALLLPPTPFLVLIAGSLASGSGVRRLKAGRVVIASSLAGVWLCCCTGSAERLAGPLLRPPPALTPQRLESLRSETGHSQIAIIILGGGVEGYAPEYGRSNLMPYSLERLRYGVWLARAIHGSAGFSGGVGWGQGSIPGEATEAVVASRIAAEEFGFPLRWIETESRDTRENAVNTVAMLERDGVAKVLLVTDYWHMPRAIRNFERAANGRISFEPAPIGFASRQGELLLRWIPSGEGLTLLRQIVRERLGLWFGA